MRNALSAAGVRFGVRRRPPQPLVSARDGQAIATDPITKDTT